MASICILTRMVDGESLGTSSRCRRDPDELCGGMKIWGLALWRVLDEGWYPLASLGTGMAWDSQLTVPA